MSEDQLTQGRIPARIAHYRILGVATAWVGGWFLQGHDGRLGLDVLIKTLDPLVGSEPDLTTRFVEEATVVSCLSHPSIISLYEIGEESGLPYLVFPALDGTDLRQRLRTRISLETGLQVVLRVLSGLAYMHDHNVIHCDLSPRGVFICTNGSVKLTDLWLATKMDTRRGPTGIARRLAAPSYLAPERIRGDDGDGRGDLFSLGCVLYEMVAGRKAFAGESRAEVLRAVVEDEVKMELIPSGGGWERVRGVIRLALKKRPEERYPSASAMASDILEALQEIR